jgi:hypothetical protein
MSNNHLNPWMLLPPAEHLCQTCAREHQPEQPHDQQSLFYQYKFYQDHGRWPTWEDALAHCEPDVQELWRVELRKAGVQL